MEKRIRTIWALSLTSALLLICVQGYWLYNQYQHVVNTFAHELAEKILLVSDEEYKIRQNEVRTQFTYFLKQEIGYASDDFRNDFSEKHTPNFAYGGKISDLIDDSLMSQVGIDIKDKKRLKQIAQTLNDSTKQIGKILNLNVESFERDSNGVYKKNASLDLSKRANVSGDNIHEEINKAIMNYNNPFRSETLDSILVADIPGISYTMTPLSIRDSIWVSSWHLSGSLSSPYLKVLYLYSPLESKGVEINVAIPTPFLFERMAVQFLLSLALIMLLTGCLILQIKTILKQKKINEMREDFVHAMIHELKRPVQTLKTFISFLGNKDMRSDEMITEQVLQDSMFELDNLSAYLKKLKDMVGADDNATSLKISRFNLQELIDKIIRLVNHPPEKDVNISTCYEMESVLIEADTVHVANVVNNLIENAIKYSAQRVDIEIKAVLKERELRLTVSDNGIGIPNSEQEKVFAKFYRGSNFPDKNIPGIGLGLSYVKLITEAHKGKVSLVSDIGKGTSVTLCLPQ